MLDEDEGLSTPTRSGVLLRDVAAVHGDPERADALMSLGACRGMVRDAMLGWQIATVEYGVLGRDEQVVGAFGVAEVEVVGSDVRVVGDVGIAKAGVAGRVVDGPVEGARSTGQDDEGRVGVLTWDERSVDDEGPAGKDGAAKAGVLGRDEGPVGDEGARPVFSACERPGDDKCPLSPKGELKYSCRIDPKVGCKEDAPDSLWRCRDVWRGVFPSSSTSTCLISCRNVELYLVPIGAPGFKKGGSRLGFSYTSESISPTTSSPRLVQRDLRASTSILGARRRMGSFPSGSIQANPM
mmetsp:Transcript_16766/g.36452  ORF Transcript_16766/g.36452 Transcript_16766/m.36452 type:complete len:296 (+) Transcript_16766:525-1412(+)